MGRKSNQTVRGEIQLLLHPDLQYEPKDVVMLYSFNEGKNWDDYLANKITPKNWQISMYDLPLNQPMWFFFRLTMKDGKLMIVKKEQKNYKVNIRDNTSSGVYKAQVRVTDANLIDVGRKCLVCEEVIPKNRNVCPNPECLAVYCPYCNRMLPPSSNYCPWCDKGVSIK